MSKHLGLRRVEPSCSCQTTPLECRCEPTIIKHAEILKKWVDRSNVQHYRNAVSRQRASPARNGVAAGIGDNFGVSSTSVAVSIQVTNALMETGHTAQHKGMGRVV